MEDRPPLPGYNRPPVAATELPNARYADPIAYVRGGYLVAQLPAGTELWLNGKEAHAHVAGYRTIIHRAVTVAKLVKGQNDLWTFEDGIISGVTYPPDVVQALEEIGFCENFCRSYDVLIQFLNTAQDALVSSERGFRTPIAMGSRWGSPSARDRSKPTPPTSSIRTRCGARIRRIPRCRARAAFATHGRLRSAATAERTADKALSRSLERRLDAHLAQQIIGPIDRIHHPQRVADVDVDRAGDLGHEEPVRGHRLVVAVEH